MKWAVNVVIEWPPTAQDQVQNNDKRRWKYIDDVTYNT